MKSISNDFKLLQHVFLTRDTEAMKAEDCPEAGTLWEAAEGKLALTERRTIIRHTMHCQDCAEGWRVAVRLGAKPTISVWAHVSYFWTLISFQIRQDLRFPAELTTRGARWIKTVFPAGTPSPSSRTIPATTTESVWASTLVTTSGEEELRQALQESLELVASASDPDYSNIERSNMFDEWKIRLLNIAERSTAYNSEFRQITGALVLATRKIDLVDLSPSNIEALRKSMMRCIPGASESDRSEVFEALKKEELLKSLPVAAKENAEQLDSILDEILEAGFERIRKGPTHEKQPSG